MRLSFASCLSILAAGCLLSFPRLASADELVPPQVQSAIDRGLAWLARAQVAQTGAWEGHEPRSGASAAVSSLAAMAFMARGHVPGQGPYGDNINKAVDYVLSLQQPDGIIADDNQQHPMYDHGISTLMLCEAYGMLDERRQKLAHTAISKAVRLILNAQAVRKSPEYQGGWRYQPGSPDSDISVSGWQLMALRGAANIGANIPPSAIEHGIEYIKKCATLSGGFRYAGGRVDAALTGTGILSLELLGQHHSKEALAGGDYLLTDGARRPIFEWHLYTAYYCTQAAWQLGGRYWEAINPPIRRALLQEQLADGSWQARTNETQGGPNYATSMAILALAVPYRYLPIYQK